MKRKKEEDGSVSASASASASDHDRDYSARRERRSLESFLKSRMRSTAAAYPSFQVYIKSDYRVAVRFQILDPSRISELMILILQRLGSEVHDSGDSRMMLDCWSRLDSNELVFSTLKREDCNQEEALCVAIVEENEQNHVIEYVKLGRWSLKELEVVESTIEKLSVKKSEKSPSLERSVVSFQVPFLKNTVDALEAMGARVFGVSSTSSACRHVTESKGRIS